MVKGCVLRGCTWVSTLCWHKVAHERCFFVDRQSSVTCVLHKYWHHLVFLWATRERWRGVASDHGWYYWLVQAILPPLEALLLQECWTVHKWSELDSAVHWGREHNRLVTPQGSSLSRNKQHTTTTTMRRCCWILDLRIILTISIDAYADSDIGFNSDPSPVLEEVDLSC